MSQVPSCPDCGHAWANHGPTPAGEPVGCSLCACTRQRWTTERAPHSVRVHNIGTYLGAETTVDESDVDLIEIFQTPDPDTIGGFAPVCQRIVITPEMATKLREILNRRHAEGRE